MVFIVGEIGVNWDGNFDLVKDMMQNVKDAGCNAVKFQSYNEEILQGHPQTLRLMKSSISKNNIDVINQLSKSVGIEWFCTPMYPEAVDLLDPFVKRFKIRERDGRPLLGNMTTPLIERAMKTNKELIVSSESSPRLSNYFNNDKIKWLYCVPKYPCLLTDLDFTKICDFNGFSNHSNEIIVPVTAAILGAEVIEVHITSDKSKEFFDNNVSLDYSELKQMAKLIRLAEKIKK